MQCCQLSHLSRDILPENVEAPRYAAVTLYMFATNIVARLGWHRLERLLDAIPESNDDFIMF